MANPLQAKLSGNDIDKALKEADDLYNPPVVIEKWEELILDTPEDKTTDATENSETEAETKTAEEAKTETSKTAVAKAATTDKEAKARDK